MRLILITTCLLGVFIESSIGTTNKIICYYQSGAATRTGEDWYGPEKIDPFACTHLNYAFAGLDQNASIVILDEEADLNQGGFEKMAALKLQNPELKVLLSIGGGGGALLGFFTVAGHQDLEKKFAQSAIDFFQKYNFDGLDIDWEYPFNANDFSSLLLTLKTAFLPGGYLLTTAVYSIPSERDGYDVPVISRTVDIINVMTYDFHPLWMDYTAENSPLYSGQLENDFDKENRNCNVSIRAWIDAGADPKKIALGVPFYGRSYKLQDTDRHNVNDPIVGLGDPRMLGYNEICKMYENSHVEFLEDMRVPYLYQDDLWVGYDNEQSVKEKVEFAQEFNLTGIFIWAIDSDDVNGYCGGKGLLSTVRETVERGKKNIK